MKFPRLISVFSIINIPVILVYAGFGISRALSLRVDPVFEIYRLNVIAFFNLVWIVGLLSSVLWYQRSKYSYVALIVYVITIIVPNVLVFAFIITDFLGVIEVVFLSALLIFTLGLFFLVFRPYHFKWALSQGRFITTIICPAIVGPFLLLCAAPTIFCLTANKVGISIEVPSISLYYTASSEDPAHPISSLSYGYFSGAWHPHSGNGVDEWIQIDVPDNNEIITKLIISCVGKDSYGSYQCAKTVVIETSDGKKFQYQLKDTDSDQLIPLPGKKYSWVRVTITSTYPGQKENRIAVSKFRVISKRKNVFKAVFLTEHSTS